MKHRVYVAGRCHIGAFLPEGVVYPCRCDLLYTGTGDNRRDRVVVRKGESFLYYIAVTSHLGGRKSIRLRPRGVGRYVVRRTLGGGGSVRNDSQGGWLLPSIQYIQKKRGSIVHIVFMDVLCPPSIPYCRR
jgi:hypothetical protein